MKAGRIAAMGTLEELRADVGGDALEDIFVRIMEGDGV